MRPSCRLTPDIAGHIVAGAGHAAAAEAARGALAVRRPVLLLSAGELAVLADGGAALVAVLPLPGLQLAERFRERRLSARAPQGRCPAMPPGEPGAGAGRQGLQLSALMSATEWLLFVPALRSARAAVSL